MQFDVISSKAEILVQQFHYFHPNKSFEIRVFFHITKVFQKNPPTPNVPLNLSVEKMNLKKFEN